MISVLMVLVMLHHRAVKIAPVCYDPSLVVFVSSFDVPDETYNLQTLVVCVRYRGATYCNDPLQNVIIGRHIMTFITLPTCPENPIRIAEVAGPFLP
jgi:hypothetical protein